MLSAVYTHKFSTARNLANRWKDAPQAETLSSGHTFYRGNVEVGHLYNYLSGPSQIEVGGEHFLLKRQNRVIVFTQNYTLEHDGRTIATAKETKLFFLSNSRISYTVERDSRELTLKNNIWNLRGRQYLVFDGKDRVGVIKHNSDFGADIDLPPKIPLAVQIFIYKLAFIMWQRGIR
jgi:hypothetical protein